MKPILLVGQQSSLVGDSIHGGTTLMSVIPPEGLTRWIFGPGTGPDGSGRAVRFIWTNFQAKRPVLDPFGTKFDDFWSDRTLAGT